MKSKDKGHRKESKDETKMTGCEHNKQKCDCPETDCVRHGKCCECVAYHRKLGQLPYCCG
ncbi:MAG: hypothetical protein KKG60_00650 [Nanoarchaeota archaeon]|nr:hypothetical protein [Nanoarchaeota archaeon]